MLKDFTSSTCPVVIRPAPVFAPVQSDPSVLAGSWLGHSDAVWGLAYSGIKNRLLSCSADGTVKLWNPMEKNPCISTFNANKGEDGENAATHRTVQEQQHAKPTVRV